MSHYEERLQTDLDAIRDRVAAVGADVGVAVTNACHALLNLDRHLAAETILGDLPINREIRSIDRLCHFFVARHLPSAGILRFVSSVLRLTVAIERIGDYAATLARQAVQLSQPMPVTVARDVEMMGEQSRRMFKQAMKAFIEGNAELAQGTKGMESQIDSTFDKVFADLLREGEERTRPIKDLFGLLVVFNRLERISDQAKNICEETVFAVTGVTKEPKVYRVMFVDERNGCWSQMAEVIARKAFPESGAYSSAGWNPAAELEPRFVAFMDQKGFDRRSVKPSPLPTTHDELDDLHVIAGMSGEVRDHLDHLPFKTVLLDWNVAPDPDVTGEALTDEMLEDAYKNIAVKVRELMVTLRGEDAS